MKQSFKVELIIVILCLFILVLQGCKTKDVVLENSLLSEGLFAVCDENKKWGYINENGEEIIPFSYDSAMAFYKGIAIVTKNDQYLLLNQKGKIITEKGYSFLARDKNEGLVWYEEGGNFGLLNLEGKEITDPIYTVNFSYFVPSFYNGYAIVKRNNLFGFINTLGEEIIPCEYTYAKHFVNGLAVVSKNEQYPRKYGYINIKNEYVLNADFTQAGDFDIYGHAQVKINDYWYMIDTQGNRLLSGVGNFWPQIRKGGYFMLDANNIVQVLDSDFSEKKTINYKYLSNDPAFHFGNEYFYAYPDGIFSNYDLIDCNGNIIKNNIKNLFEYYDGTNFYFFDREKSEIYVENKTYSFSDMLIKNINNELINGSINNKYGVMNYNKDILLDFIYDNIKFSDDYIIVKKDGKIGITNFSGEFLIEPIKYTNICDYIGELNPFNAQPFPFL